jgi:hypothetical protein
MILGRVCGFMFCRCVSKVNPNTSQRRGFLGCGQQSFVICCIFNDISINLFFDFKSL